MKRYLLSMVLLFVIFTNSFSNILNWKTMEMGSYIIFFKSEYKDKAKDILAYMNQYELDIKKLTANENEFKTIIVLQDLGIISNAYANSVDFKISIFTNEPDTSSILTSNNWLRYVSRHEYTHISQLSNSTGVSKLLTTLMGNYFSPNSRIPYWMIEGIAVYSESEISEYEGRLNSGEYDAIIASKVNEGEFPSLHEMNVKMDTYPLGQYYLYGSQFIKYLSEKYGEEKLSEFFKYNSNNYLGIYIGELFPVIGIDRSAKAVFGKTFVELKDEWHEYERIKYRDWEIMGKSTGEKCEYLTYSNGKIYYIKPNKMINGAFDYSTYYDLMEYTINSKNIIDIKKIKTFKNRNIGDIKIKNNKIYYIKLEIKKGYANIDISGYGYVGILYEYDIKTNKEKKLFKDEIKNFEVLDSGEIIYFKQEKNRFGSELYKYNGEINKIGIANELISEMIQFKEKIVIVSKTKFGSWNINKIDLNTFKIERLVNSLNNEIQIKKINNNLYFTANYNKKLNVYQYNFNENEIIKVSEGDYAFGGFVIGEDIYFMGMTANGPELYKSIYMTEKYKYLNVEKDNLKLNLDIVNNKDLKINNGFFKNLSYLFRMDNGFLQRLTNGRDALGLNSYNVFYQASTNSKDYIDFNFNTKLFNPFEFSYYYSGNEYTNNIYIKYPLYKSINRYMKYLSVDYNTEFNNGFNENKIGLTSNFSTIKTILGTEIKYNLDTEDIDGNISLKYLYNNGSLNLNYYFFENKNLKNIIRGFDYKEDNSNGYKLSIDYITKIYETRVGIWNPNIFMGDTFVNVLVDLASIENSLNENLNTKDYFGLGIELISELSIMYDLELKLILGMVYSTENTTEDYKGTTYILIEQSF